MLVRLLLAVNLILATQAYADDVSYTTGHISAGVVATVGVTENSDGTFTVAGDQPIYATYDAATNTEMFYY